MADLTSHPSGDEFTDAMWQHMQTVNNAVTAKINELRREVKALKAELAVEHEARYSIQSQLWEALDELERRSTVYAPFSIKDSLRRGAKGDSNG